MSEAEAASQKPLSGYALPRRDESVIAAMPHSLAPSRVHSPAPAPSASRPAASAPMQSVMSAAMREEDQTMVARSRFGDEMSVHDERTVIGQIPKEALEFERMFAQRTQPPPPDAPSAPASASPPATPVPSAPAVPSLSVEQSEASVPPAPSAPRESADDGDSASPQAFSRSEPPTVGNQPTSDTRGLVSLAEATHPSVVRAVSARRLRVTLITLLVLAVLVLLFVIQMPR